MGRRMIEYRNGDLFSAPSTSILLHACNAQGVWGSGVAKEFKKRFPLAFQDYEQFCLKNNRSRDIVGQSFISSSDQQLVACLITSHKYGIEVDSPAEILHATELAFLRFIESIRTKNTTLVGQLEVHLPKINSGLFRVPWLETEKCIEYCLSNVTNDIKMIVWDNQRQ